MNVRKIVFLSAVAFSLLSPFSLQAADWDYEVELYMIGTSISGDSGIGRADGVEVDIDFDDILAVLNLAGMVHFEALHKSGWGTALDYSFMDLRDDISGPQGGVVNAKVRQGVLQADLLYRVAAGKGSLDYITGIRWWDNDFEVTIDPAVLPGSHTAKSTVDWVDLFVGARWITPVTEKLDFAVRGDVGGFGLEADFTASLFANLRYGITESWLLDIGYKAVWVDYETGTQGQRGYFAYDTVTHGPLFGLIYKF